ncbi:hypothetical protein FQA39_LY03077 [Lamprigera yunnana]|nr:hypothetical protein FQA39_LY03077 [Lamprigera yunnana]
MRVSLSVTIVAMTSNTSANADVPIYPWTDQSIVLSSFFWGYVLSPILIGQLAKKYGAKWFITIALTIASIFSVLIPFVAQYGSWTVMLCRAIQGFANGSFFPCCHNLLSKWCPLQEKSRLSTFVYAAGPLGMAISMICSGFISATWVGWPYVFYGHGAIGLLLMVVWSILGKNSPTEHKTIDPREKEFIVNSIGNTLNVVQVKTPWTKIPTSLPFLAIIISNLGQVWGVTTLSTNVPRYASKVLGFDITSNGVLSAGPHLLFWVSSFVYSFATDYIITHKIVSTTIARKIANSIGFYVPGIALLILGLISDLENITGATLAMFYIAQGLSSAFLCGYNVNLIDLAPNHAGTLMGISSSLGHVCSIIAPLIVQFIVVNEEDAMQWATVFYISAGIYLASNTFYLIFGSGEIQKWNYVVPLYGARHTQALLLFGLMAISLAMRVSLSVTIVAMTSETSPNADIPIYSWTDQSVLLSSFFWGYVFSPIAAGQLAEKYGAKWFITTALTIASIFSILIPFLAPYGSWTVMLCRVIQGSANGFFVPCCHNLLSKWSPPQEKSRLTAFVYAAGPLGMSISMICSGFICATWIGWPYVFYGHGAIGLLFMVVWCTLGKSSPSEHKTIDPREKEFIINSTGNTLNVVHVKTPWTKIATSLPFWAILISSCGQVWGATTQSTNVPRYVSKVLGFDITDNGILSAGPHLLFWVSSFVYSFAADYIITHKIVSTTIARKIANSIGLYVPGTALLILGSISSLENITGATLAMFYISQGFCSAFLCGYNVNLIDLAPNHAGTLMGISNTLGHVCSIIAPLIVQFIVVNEEDAMQWATVFYISAGIYLASNTFYLIFGSGEIQKWNYVDTENSFSRK